MKGEGNRAKSSENYFSADLGCLKDSDSYRFVRAKLNKRSTLLTTFAHLDADGMEDELFENKIAY